MANYKNEKGSKVAFDLSVTEDAFKKAQKTVIQNFKQNVEIKGFRKGHAPESAVMAQLGLENLTMESLNTVIDREYKKFITENKISPISHPSVEVGDINKMPVKVSVAVEVFPEVKLGDYKKIKTKKIEIKVKADEIEDVIETIMADMTLGVSVKRAAKKKDQVVVSFAGKDKDGKVLKNTEGKETPFRLGFGHFLEDLEKGIEGMKPGEEKTKIPVKFPKNYHAKDMAGSTVFFDVTLHEVKEITSKAIDESMIEKIVGQKKSIEDFKKDIENLIITNKSNAERKELTDKYKENLVAHIKVDLPESWLEREVSMRMKEIKASPQYAASPEKFWTAIKKTEKDLEKEFSADAEKGLKIFLGLSEIVKVENIELNKDDHEIVHQRVHQKVAADDHSSNEHSVAMERETLNFKIDKFLNTLFS